jgi:thioredoxin reductase
VALTKNGVELKTKAVIIATGAKQLRLKVPGEREYMMKGLCYSALSYAPLFIDRAVVVIGDGELALRSAAELATIAKQVSIISASDKMYSSVLGKKLSRLANVTTLIGYEVVEVRGDEFARNIVVRDPGGKVSELPADGTFIEKALIPNSQMVADLVELDEQGRIRVDCGCRTNVPGVFAAGDVASGFAEQVLIAVGEGAKAALSAYEYLLPKL